MEDRITPALYLEMADVSPLAYAADRVAEVMGWSGVERASWWSPVKPHRDDLSVATTLEEFATLGLYEVANDFVPRVHPPGIRTLHLRQCARPGQGFLSGAPTLGLLVVLYSAREFEKKAELRDWADFVHNPPLAMGGFGYRMITPYENVAVERPHFLHLYEMDSADPEAIFMREIPEMKARFGPFRSPEFQRWFVHPQLVLDYANTFVRMGARGWDSDRSHRT